LLHDLRRALVLLAACGCASTSAPATGDLRLDLQHGDPRIRIEAALRAVVEKRLEVVGELINNLSDRDGAVRMFSSVALRKLTGRDFGYLPHGTESERAGALARWRAWFDAEAADAAAARTWAPAAAAGGGGAP
jgi:hypothetical protein